MSDHYHISLNDIQQLLAGLERMAYPTVGHQDKMIDVSAIRSVFEAFINSKLKGSKCEECEDPTPEQDLCEGLCNACWFEREFKYNPNFRGE